MKGCRPLTDSEIESTLASMNGEYKLRDRALLLCGIRTGLRITELCKLKIKDVLINGEISERVHVAKSSIKNKREGRSIVFHPEARAAVKAWIDFISPVSGEQYLFSSQKNSGLTPMTRQHAWRIIKDAFDAAGVTGNTGTHSLRKTFAAKIYKITGKDLKKTQLALGHAKIESTGEYLCVSDDEVDQAILSA